jgi:lysophospholipid acyltransferase (LPLAT)-like uncharacterized protein
MWKQKALGFMLWAVYRTWISTWRMTVVEHPELQRALKNKEPFVFAFWHGDELPCISLSLRYKVATMVSSSRDGELMNTAAKLMGVETSRGSSTRGGARALLGLVRLAAKGRIPSVAVDGPKGPYHKVKPGVFLVSRKMNAKIFPAGVAATRAKIFEKSWNKTYLPLPFSRVVVVWGEPLAAIADETDQKLAERLEFLLDAAGQAAARLITNPSTS